MMDKKRMAEEIARLRRTQPRDEDHELDNFLRAIDQLQANELEEVRCRWWGND